jgi:hypothetical protein
MARHDFAGGAEVALSDVRNALLSRILLLCARSTRWPQELESTAGTPRRTHFIRDMIGANGCARRW